MSLACLAVVSRPDKPLRLTPRPSGVHVGVRNRLARRSSTASRKGEAETESPELAVWVTGRPRQTWVSVLTPGWRQSCPWTKGFGGAGRCWVSGVTPQIDPECCEAAAPQARVRTSAGSAGLDTQTGLHRDPEGPLHPGLPSCPRVPVTTEKPIILRGMGPFPRVWVWVPETTSPHTLLHRAGTTGECGLAGVGVQPQVQRQP